MQKLKRLLLALPMLTLAVPAFAHGLLVSAQAEGETIQGRVYYSDGQPGVGEYVELKSFPDAQEPINSTVTDPEGRFRFQGTSGQRYLIVAHGDEGHRTEIKIALKDGERGQLVDRDSSAEEDQEGWFPPAWMLIGGLLLLSLIPAVWLKSKRAASR